ncbi:MAG TPA: pyridoxamine 5'-phosphate oxidase family protein [Iamia sp.]|nr:pyridoxamine 5'-phosphate oxidase family protein [Iamia sp.]
MSIAVELDDLPAKVATRTGQAYLVTIRDERPHVVSVAPDPSADGTIVVGAGRRTTANIAAHPEVTLLWPTDEGDPKHSLLVDGTAAPSADGDTLLITPTSAILHRVRAATDSTGC